MKKSSGKSRLLDCLKENVGEIVSRDILSERAAVYDWQRSVRSLRSDDGWDIDTLPNGYRLNSLEQTAVDTKREYINNKDRYAVLHRDNSTCQRCGASKRDGVKLHVDHKTPVSLGGKSNIDNLWTLCESCNLGKKNLFADDEENILKIVFNETSGYQRLKKYLELNPNKHIPSEKLQVISNVRDWTRSLRDIRNKYSMQIEWVQPNESFPNGAYVYIKNE